MNMMMGDELVSVIICAYNQQEFVGEAIQSALNQTYSPLEIIISDDLSTDSTFEIIQNAVSKYKGRHGFGSTAIT